MIATMVRIRWKTQMRNRAGINPVKYIADLVVSSLYSTELSHQYSQRQLQDTDVRYTMHVNKQTP